MRFAWPTAERAALVDQLVMDDFHLLQARPYGVALTYAGGSFLIALLAVTLRLWTGSRLSA
ncbi:MAG TPA: hypothetical protein VEQ60_16760 [Longimicrobium sp.]|nr:hypothetical protein [Longimicrobium sp.]